MAHLQYNCDSCRQTIPVVNPRVHCLVCPDYDLCANCYLGERCTQGHVIGHAAQVFKQSGGNGAQPVPASNPTSPPLPARGPPPLPSRSVNAQTAFPSTSPLAANGATTTPGWQPWFSPDSSPTPAFTTLINDIFTHLDPSNVGNLVPETFSRFEDDMGRLLHENACMLPLIVRCRIISGIFAYQFV